MGPLRWPGIEPGSTAWKAAMLTTIPPTLHSRPPRHAGPGLAERGLRRRRCPCGGRAQPGPDAPSASSSALRQAPPSAAPGASSAPALRSCPRPRPERFWGGGRGGGALSLPCCCRALGCTPRPDPSATHPGSPLAKALLQRLLGEATPRHRKGTGLIRPTPFPAAVKLCRCASRRKEPTAAATVGGPQCRRALVGSRGGPRSAVAPERPARRTGKGLQGWRAGGGRGWAGPAGGRRDEKKGRWGQAAGQRAAPATKKGRVASPSGNRTPVSRVTGGGTHHYTNEDGGGHAGARLLSGCLQTPTPCPRPSAHHGRPPRARPDPTRPDTTPNASCKEAARDPARDTDPRGAGNSQCALPIAPDARIAPGGGGPRGPESSSKAVRRRWALAVPRPGRRGGGVGAAGGRSWPDAAHGWVRPGVGEGAAGGAGRDGWPRCPVGRRAPGPSRSRTAAPWRRAPRRAKGIGSFRVASGPSQPSGDAPRPAVRMAERSKALRSVLCAGLTETAQGNPLETAVQDTRLLAFAVQAFAALLSPPLAPQRMFTREAAAPAGPSHTRRAPSDGCPRPAATRPKCSSSRPTHRSGTLRESGRQERRSQAQTARSLARRRRRRRRSPQAPMSHTRCLLTARAPSPLQPLPANARHERESQAPEGLWARAAVAVRSVGAQPHLPRVACPTGIRAQARLGPVPGFLGDTDSLAAALDGRFGSAGWAESASVPASSFPPTAPRPGGPPRSPEPLLRSLTAPATLERMSMASSEPPVLAVGGERRWGGVGRRRPSVHGWFSGRILACHAGGRVRFPAHAATQSPFGPAAHSGARLPSPTLKAPVLPQHAPPSPPPHPSPVLPTPAPPTLRGTKTPTPRAKPP
nr:collagen alpha-1(I) chain-like [Camelus dromedarius]